jgi:nitrous oxidase accessory protein NosD
MTQRRALLRLLASLVLAISVLLSALFAPAAYAAAIFVRTDGSDTLCSGGVDAPAANAPNCAFATIQKGVVSADVGGIVNVRAGLYNENVQVAKGITLRGAQAGVDARTRASTPAAAESIIGNAAYVTANNVVIDGFTIQGGDNMGGDFGTGLYLLASASGYQVINNIIQNNTFGLYLNSGGATQTIVRHNLFRNNNAAGAASGDAIYSDQGLVNALIDGNSFVDQAVAAVDLSRTSPPAQSNLIITNNSIVRSARPFIILNTNSTVIANNTISGASSAAHAAFYIYGGVSGLAIVGNAIVNNAGHAVLIRNNLAPANINSNILIHFNRIVGNMAGGIAVITSGYSGILDAENNWWGCNAGPGTAGCDAVNINIDANPWLTLRLGAAPGSIFVGSRATLTADLTVNSGGADTSASGHILDGTPITFSGILGSVAPTSAGTLSGAAQSIYTAGTTPGNASASAQLDNALVTASLTLSPKLTSATALASSANPAVFGQAITLTASVSAVPAGTGTPTGTVTFRQKATILGTSALDGAGHATLSNIQLGVGNHPITAFYSGNAAFEPSDSSAAPLSQVVAKANTTTTISADTPDPSPIGGTVTVQFSVSASPPGAGLPTGSVMVSASGWSCLSALSSGAGSCALILPTAGSTTLTATYAGDGNFKGSSATVAHEVVYLKTYLPLIIR